MRSTRALAMKKTAQYVLAAFIALTVLVTIMERSARAAGTPAGVTISSLAIATYDYGGSPQPPITALTSLVVDQKINLIAATTNGVPVSVTPGAASQVLTFTVTNTGNSVQDFALAAVPAADPFGGTDNFDAANPQVFAESGVTAGYQAAEDTGTYLDELAADAVRTVYIVADMPGAQVSGDVSALSLVATARSGGVVGVLGGVVPETVGPNTQAAVDTVFADGAGVADGIRDSAHSAASAYRVASAMVSLLEKRSGDLRRRSARHRCNHPVYHHRDRVRVGHGNRCGDLGPGSDKYDLCGRNAQAEQQPVDRCRGCRRRRRERNDRRDGDGEARGPEQRVFPGPDHYV